MIAIDLLSHHLRKSLLNLGPHRLGSMVFRSVTAFRLISLMSLGFFFHYFTNGICDCVGISLIAFFLLVYYGILLGIPDYVHSADKVNRFETRV